jgi:N-acyl-L-homoserine lactone synthetase
LNGAVMGFGVVPEKRNVALRVKDYRPEIEYRIATTQEELDQIYRLRYRAYLREGAIDPNPSERFTDDYDRLDNCWIFGVHADDRLVSSIRLHVISRKNRKGPALDVFPDIVSPLIESGRVLVDPTRFVSDEEANRRYPELAFITMRVPCMACLSFDADYCLVTVKAEHRAFYQRIFEAKVLSEPRPYPTLKHRICLLQIEVARMRDVLMARHSVFQSSVADWQAIFESARMARQVSDTPPLVPGILN